LLPLFLEPGEYDFGAAQGGFTVSVRLDAVHCVHLGIVLFRER